MIRLRYEERQTYTKIGKAMGITAERVRYLLRDAESNLRRPDLYGYILHGKLGRELHRAQLEKEKENATVDKMKIEVRDMGLPIRAANRLIARNCDTVADVAALSKDEIMQIKMLGAVSRHDVAKKLESMSEFDDTTVAASDNMGADTPGTSDWTGFDFDVTDEVGPDITELPDVANTSDSSMELEFDGNDIPSEAEKAADYARSFRFDKAADYIERHYDGDEFVPGNPIPITTRNMALDGLESENGVSFKRRTAELADGLSVEGVFPEFDSRHHVELGSAANDMSLHQQFNACREDFQEHMYDGPEKLQDITFGAMERMDSPRGYTPEGFSWQHNPETGSFDLVSQEDHSVGHTGGNALWGS